MEHIKHNSSSINEITLKLVIWFDGATLFKRGVLSLYMQLVPPYKYLKDGTTGNTVKAITSPLLLYYIWRGEKKTLIQLLGGLIVEEVTNISNFSLNFFSYSL